MFNLVKGRNIGVDICNTLADVNTELNLRLGDNPDPAVYFHPSLRDKPNFFEENLDIFLTVKPIDNSVEVLRELSKHNKIFYITARPQLAESVTRLWLFKKNGYPDGDVYFTNNKVEIANKLGIDLAIEDAPHELVSYIKEGIEVLVKKQVYNQNFKNRFDWGDRLVF